MNLQKNDKIILVVGVVILIAAAGAIAIYTTQSNGDDDNLGNQADEDKTYIVERSEETRELDGKTYSIGLPKLYSLLSRGKSVSDDNCFTIDRDNIKSIEINVSYTDNKMGLPLLGIIGQGRLNIGKDELSVKIIDPDDVQHEIKITGNGKKTITIDGKFTSIPQNIDAKSMEEAKMELEEYYSTEWTGKSFKLTASLKISERIHLLNRIIERLFKDTFKIDIKYHYYEYALDEIIDENNLENENDEDTETGIADLYLYMSYGRQMI